MNLVYGEVVEIFRESGIQMGRIRFGGAMRKAPLDLICDAALGDRVLLCDGVAIGKVEDFVNDDFSPVTNH